ncbi:MAG: hypothetical protein J5726_01000 [Treponema sp.]|nr:hypothetical protein [Treponema sp.]
MLFFSIIVYTAFGLMCVWFVISGVRKLNQEKQNAQLSDLYVDEKAHDEAIKQSGEFELNYFERVRNGEQTQQFLAIAGQPASAMIRSLLCAAGIPSYAENEHINAMYALNSVNSSSAFAIKVFILVADYDSAYEIVTDFLSKQEQIKEKEMAEGEEESAARTARKVAGAVMTGLFFMPMPDGSEEKPMGVTILPKV